MSNRHWMLFSAAVLAAVLGFGLAFAKTPREALLIGQTLPLSGPAGALAREIDTGRHACVDAINARGGINEHRLALATVDDRGVPAQASRAVNAWIDESRIVAMLGPMGADVNEAVLKLAAHNGLLIVGPVDGDIGSRVLAGGEDATAVFLTANQSAEAESIARHVATLGLKRIAVVVAQDASGRASQVVFDEALGVLGLSPVAVVSIRADGGNVRDAVKAVQGSSAQAVILATTGTSTVAFIDGMAQAREDGPVPLQFYGMSTALTPKALAGLGRRAYGLSMTTVLPSFDDTRMAAAETFRTAMKTSNATPSPLAFEGCLSVLALARILADAGPEPTKSSALKAARSLPSADVGGLTFDLRPSSGRIGGSAVDMWFVDADGRLRR